MPATSTSIFPERRTRSQLTLPDTVLAIPEKSPLKIAKSRNTMTPMDKDAVVEDSEGEDELMLSPSRTKRTPPVVVAEPGKRSASPAREDEYALGSSGGRDLKRRKRDVGGEGGMGIDDDEGSGLATPQAEPPRRSTRRKYTPSNRKPVSTVSASPPPTAAHSPAPVNGRAQSVPLFASSEDLSRTDLPRLDLTKILLRSPKRKRSRSRSPVKDHEQPKLRITNVNAAAIPCRLPTIHAGIATGSGSGSLSDGESSVAEERELEMQMPVTTAAAVPPPPPPPQSSSPATQDAPSSPLVMPVARHAPVPATPATVLSLDQTIPMSPLTPVPPTPFPPIRRPAAYIKSRLGMQADADEDENDDDDTAGGIVSSSVAPHVKAQESSFSATNTTAVASSSRLPPTSVPSKSDSRSSGSGPSQPPGPNPNININTNNNTNPNIKKPSALLPSSSSMPSLTTFNPLNTLKSKPTPNPTGRGSVFDMLVASSKAKGKGKAVAPSSSSLPSGIGPSFAPVVSKPVADSANTNANGQGKMKLKDRMRRKAKEAVEKAPVIEALPEEEEDEDGGWQVLEETRKEEVGDDKDEKDREDVAEKDEDEGKVGPRPEAGASQEPEQELPAVAGPSSAVGSAEGQVQQIVQGGEDVVMKEDAQQPQELQSDDATAVTDTVTEDSELAAEAAAGGVEDKMETATTPGPVVQMAESSTTDSIEEAISSDSVQQQAEALLVAQMDVEKENGTNHVGADVAIEQPAAEAEAEGRPVADADEEGDAGTTEAADQEQDHDHDLDAPPAKQSKTALGKKRQPAAATAIPLPTRVTRSSSTRKQGADVAQPAPAGPSRKQPKPTLKAPLKRTASGKVKLPEASTSSSSRLPQDNASPERRERPRTPGSPMKLSTPKKAAPALTKGGDDIRGEKYTGGARSTANTPVAKRSRGSPSPRRPASSPSPMKVSRALPEYTPIRPSGITRTFSASQIFTRPGSSLSQLSSALQKLHQPAPARPSTSMGFNHDAGDETDNEPLTTKDDAAIGQRKSIGLVRTGSSASQRSVTLGSDALKSAASSSSTTTTVAAASSSSSSLTRPTASSQAKLVQKKLPFGPNKTATGAPRFGAAAARGRLVGGGGVSKVRPLFGVGGGLRRTASKKSSLPVVIGSPVKGGSSSNAVGAGTAEEEQEDEEEEEEGGEIFNTIMNTGGSATTLLTNLLAQQPERDKDSHAHKPPSHSRRVSMLSRDLLVAATAPPPPPPASSSQTTGAGPSGSGGKGLMGPPPTPPSVASARSTSDSGSPSTGAAKRSSARIAKSAAAAAAVETSVAAGKKRAMDPPPVPNPAAEALQVLNECVIFVDVKTDEGDEAGTLFVDMLGTLGARVAAGVGQRCTHIVFKNGLSSTTNKYRALRDPKPHVVSIGWVVACAEQRRHVPEAEYLVDLEFANILGANKRRRASAFHKLPDYSDSAERVQEDATEDGDRSMDGSVSSITMEDDGLAPLERARRRKSMMIGLNH